MAARPTTPTIAASAALVAAAALGCAPERFVRSDSGVDRDIRAVHATRDDGLWMVGAAGLILRFDGDQYVDTSSDADPGPRVPNYWDVSDLQDTIYVVGDRGLVLRQDGLELPEDDNRDDARLLTVVRAGPRALYAGGESGRVRRRDRDEVRWSGVSAGAGEARVTGGWAASAESVVFSTDRGTVIEQVDGAWVTQTVVTETSTEAVPLFDVWSATVGADLLAVGLGGAVYRRTAGADEWRREDTGTDQDLYALYGSRPDDVFAVGARGTILHYDGAGWRGVPSSTARDLFGIDGTADGSLVVAGGAQGAVVVLRR